jgi:hypothetical protein
MGVPRTLVVAAAVAAAGCSTCSVWDDCTPGDERPCDYESYCGHCDVARQVCRDNHQWGPCECVDWDHGEPDSYDVHDPSWLDAHEPDLEAPADVEVEILDAIDIVGEDPEDGP